jgi:hypothetical protein
MDWVVEDVLERGLVLLLGLDQLRPEPAAKDMVAPAVSAIERACVLAVEVPHAVGEVREWCLDDQVIVVAHQAACVQLPAVPASNALQDPNERVPVGVVEHDRRVVVAARPNVVVRAGGEGTECATHSVRR